MNDVIRNLLERRTIRHYKEDQIAEEELQLILQAGLYASTAGGRQSPVMLVCQNREMNERLGRINRAAFGHANSDGIHFVSQIQKASPMMIPSKAVLRCADRCNAIRSRQLALWSE